MKLLGQIVLVLLGASAIFTAAMFIATTLMPDPFADIGKQLNALEQQIEQREAIVRRLEVLERTIRERNQQ